MVDELMICEYLLNRAHFGDAFDLARCLPDESVNCIVTSPAYWSKRDYGVDGQWGLEATPAEYVTQLVVLFAELRRALRSDGTCWVNIGDTYCNSDKGGYRKARSRTPGSWDNPHLDASDLIGAPNRQPIEDLKPKDLVGIPWMTAFALRDDGWWLRQEIIWSKPNAAYRALKDRAITAHEQVFLLTKGERYWHDEEKFHNLRSVWTIPTQPYSDVHFATFPEALPTTCILAGCPKGGVVLDPFIGSGTVGQVAQRLGRQWIGFDIDPKNRKLIDKRTAQQGLFADVTLGSAMERSKG